MNENEIGAVVVDCAVRLHIALGPGLLETVYEVILVHQLQKAGLKVEVRCQYRSSFKASTSLKVLERT